MRATFRTAAVAAGAVTVLALPAAHAFAADAPTTPSQQQQEKKKEVKRELVGSPKFDKGWSGKVYDLVEYVNGVRTSNLGYEADVAKDGQAKGTLKGHDGKGMAKTVTQKIDGITFTLTFNGDLTAKGLQEGAGQHGRTFVKEYKNLGASGFDARVYKTKAGFEADILNGKAVWHTMKTDGKKADTAQHNGAHFVLNPDGTLKGWTEGTATKPTTKPGDPKPETKPAPPKGGVKAGAEGMDPATSGDSAGLIAGGAGLAATGAAALGFALLRRGRTES
ncbi:hypothetical protein ACGFYU_22105 [Streptomyces sp. NPDC048337]|uniref:hypothetical protein n=1 Tax=Streptomyces sp. NPDC048337 TaxID=3365535 RepID=UPI003712F9D6